VGPAAENRILFAGIYCDHGRTAARTGLGAVMASKNLKAIAVLGNAKAPQKGHGFVIIDNIK